MLRFDGEKLAALRGIVEAVDKLKLRELVSSWNGEGNDEPNEPHRPGLGVTLRTNCGQVYAIDEAVERARAALGESV